MEWLSGVNEWALDALPALVILLLWRTRKLEGDVKELQRLVNRVMIDVARLPRRRTDPPTYERSAHGDG